MKLIISFLTSCVLVLSSQAYVLDEKFFQDNEEIIKDIRNLTQRLNDRSTFTATVNNFGDKLLANFDKLVKNQNLDPLNMDDQKEKFPFGSLKLSDIYLNGMSTVYRSGSASMTYEKDSEQLTIHVPIGLEHIEFGCNFKAVMLLLGPKGKVKGGVKDVEIETSIMIDFNAYRAIVRKFDIKKMGHIGISFHGNPLTDWAVNVLLNATTTMFQGIIKLALDLVIGGSMDKAVEQMNELFALLK